MRKRIVIIGGGAAGLMAAATAAGSLRKAGISPESTEVLVVEQNNRLGRKLRITGKGRCNLTNDCGRDEFMANVPTNPRFLYAALSGFDVGDTKAYFESLSVPLKVERGKRVFPVSDRADDVADALVQACRKAEVRFVNGRVSAIERKDGVVSAICMGDRCLEADTVILCTGGCTYPTTGSDGNGYRLARSVGHTIQTPIPSLVPLVCKEDICRRMMGLSLRNVRLQVWNVPQDKIIYEDFGELLFTHFGVTGPLVLSASAHMHDLTEGRYRLSLNIKPALDDRELDSRIQSDFRKYANRDFINALGDLLPLKAIEPLAVLSGIDLRKKVHDITKVERHRLVDLLHDLRLTPIGFRPMAEAIVTHGGVSVNEVNPKTMQSRLCSGLYFAGEVLDVDAYTGGFNLQIAFSTAHLAALSAVQELSETPHRSWSP